MNREEKINRSSATTHVVPRRRAFTMIELMVVIAIIVLLASLVLYSGNKILAAGKVTKCKNQIQLLSNAIQKYADAWPAWKVPVLVAGNPVVKQISDRGYPDWNGARLFSLGQFAPGPFIDPGNWNLSVIYTPDYIETAGETLAYQLTQPINGGPFIKEDEYASVRLHTDDEMYPSLSAGAKLSRRELTDPWSSATQPHFLRYSWLYRSNDPQHPSGWIRVFDARNNPPIAAGFVIESAGPDGKFGDLWKASYTNPTTDPDVTDAADNIYLRVP